MELRKYFSKFLRNRRKKLKLSEKDLALSVSISKMIAQEIKDISLYRQAFTLKASSKKGENYERLEFLGDSILGSTISCYLFKTYPDANEGYLTQMKSKIVNRKNLNKIGDNLKLVNLIQAGNTSVLSENISGNLFEALVGAIYLDLGYEACKDILLKKLVPPQELLKLENKIASYKSILLEWSQKKKVELKYDTQEEHQNKHISFKSCVWIDGKKISCATESSKKKAEEKAAQRAFYTLNKKEHILEKSKLDS